MRETRRRFIRRGRAGQQSRRRWWATPSPCTMARSSFRFTSPRTWSATSSANLRRRVFSKAIAPPARRTKSLRLPVRRAVAEVAEVAQLPQHRKRVEHDQESNKQIHSHVAAKSKHGYGFYSQQKR